MFKPQPRVAGMLKTIPRTCLLTLVHMYSSEDHHCFYTSVDQTVGTQVVQLYVPCLLMTHSCRLLYGHLGHYKVSLYKLNNSVCDALSIHLYCYSSSSFTIYYSVLTMCTSMSRELPPQSRCPLGCKCLLCWSS